MEAICLKTATDQTVRKIWLLYYNRYLYEHGFISEAERNHMIIAINSKYKNRKDAS